MRRTHVAAGIAALATVLVCGLAACGGGSPAGPATRSASSGRAPASVVPVTTRSAAASQSATTPSGLSGPRAHLPRGGTKIIGHYRVVAYYGVAGNPSLGVLGAGSAQHAARSVIARSRGYAKYGLPVQPAMELIATVAQGSPGPDGDYSNPLPRAVIEHYLAVAHKYRMLLVLDLQPGRASFLSQAKALKKVLLDPSVGLGLDPEWKVTHGAPGGGRIGSTTAKGVNDVTGWLSHLVRRHHLPDKLEIVHEFTTSMIPHRSAVHLRPGVEVTFHADGFGTRAVKRHVFRGLKFPGHPFGTGFKLFLTQDTHMMRPAQVMTLRPRPDVVTYQ
ncbi:hypothetical protein [Jatrophihabitans endophyticus]|uniref:hypothetical protein n=1 Tax=Jatrophihabitans endophyticus TaxID=1206085 RepID=UPI0019D950C3|nr:hypothetical protein [Jatrophihabitans endophyticus]MBE7188106.1 hypothetical protein [Jatrophihabitans endophyticus]